MDIGCYSMCMVVLSEGIDMHLFFLSFFCNRYYHNMLGDLQKHNECTMVTITLWLLFDLLWMSNK